MWVVTQDFGRKPKLKFLVVIQVVRMSSRYYQKLQTCQSGVLLFKNHCGSQQNENAGAKSEITQIFRDDLDLKSL
jgi:hypothetical protein